MAWWQLVGRVTRPVDLPDGPTVIPPRTKFEAPASAVAHLIRAKEVVPLKPHQIPKPPVESKDQPESKEDSVVAPPKAPVEPTKREETPDVGPSVVEEPVVASGEAEPEKDRAPSKAKRESKPDGKEQEQEQPEKKKKGGRKTKRGRRG